MEHAEQAEQNKTVPQDTSFLKIEIDADLHRAIRVCAAGDGLSIRDWCTARLREATLGANNEN